jgi:hypothetical protein
MDVTEVPLGDTAMRMVATRIKSYECWPLSFIDQQKLAAAGLYCTGYEDVTRCPFCNLLFGYWKFGENPFCKHRGKPPLRLLQRTMV